MTSIVRESCQVSGVNVVGNGRDIQIQCIENQAPFHEAAANGHVQEVKTLLNAGAKINSFDYSGYTALHQAAINGHEDITLFLLKEGAYIDTQDQNQGNTALHEAAWKGYSRTVKALCKHRANVYIKNRGGFTALHLASQNGHNESCRMLLLSACKPDVRNSYGDTALHTAARYGHAGVLRILISAFCSVNETNKNGDTALHISAAMCRRKLTRILMEAGCEQKLRNNQGETARDIAERKGYADVVSILDHPPMTFIPVPNANKIDSNGNEKKKMTKKEKSKKNHNVHFFMESDLKQNAVSPYGCSRYPNLQFLKSLKLHSLPDQPLKSGEQYFSDLAGNIKKGPRSSGCYCAPFFIHVEQKLDSNKKELLQHIDVKNKELKEKITHLKHTTHNKLFNLNQRMKESLASERAECNEMLTLHLQQQNRYLQEPHYCNGNKTHLFERGINSPLNKTNVNVDAFKKSPQSSEKNRTFKSKSANDLCQQSKYQSNDIGELHVIDAPNDSNNNNNKYHSVRRKKIPALKTRICSDSCRRGSKSEGDLSICDTDNATYSSMHNTCT